MQRVQWAARRCGAVRARCGKVTRACRTSVRSAGAGAAPVTPVHLLLRALSLSLTLPCQPLRTLRLEPPEKPTGACQWRRSHSRRGPADRDVDGALRRRNAPPFPTRRPRRAQSREHLVPPGVSSAVCRWKLLLSTRGASTSSPGRAAGAASTRTCCGPLPRARWRGAADARMRLTAAAAVSSAAPCASTASPGRLLAPSCVQREELRAPSSRTPPCRCAARRAISCRL